MRAKKILKVTSIVVASLAVLLLFLVAFFLFNPFEGSLPEMRDVVPRGVDFFAHKGGLSDDFEDTEQFPYVPRLNDVGETEGWRVFKQGRLYQTLGLTQMLQRIRREFTQIRADVPLIHPVDDLIGNEIQVAGHFGPRGWEDARYCVYTRVSWRGKAAYSALAYGVVRDELSAQGIVVADEGEFFKLELQGMLEPVYVARYLDCLMAGNDLALVADSFELAQGNTQHTEALGPSSHYMDGVRRPLQEWQTRIDLMDPNRLELFLRPDNLIPKMPGLRNWPDTRDEDDVNAKILSSFINLDSWRFLSGSMIFEPNSLTLLTHLFVNDSKHTPFQKKLFKAEATPRSEWMDQFFQMVSTQAVGAAALRLPADDFIREMVVDGLDAKTRKEVNDALRSAGRKGGLESLITELSVNLRPRVGVVLQPNEIRAEYRTQFNILNESPFPQWAWVFWVEKDRAGRPRNKALRDLIVMLRDNRQSFNINNAYKMPLSGAGVEGDVAFEFAIPQVPGTGAIALCTYGEYFIFGNSGPLIRSMVRTLNRAAGTVSRVQDEDFKEFVDEMPDAVNGVVFVWSDKLKMILQHFREFAQASAGEVDPSFAQENLPSAENRVLRTKYTQYRSKAQIPPGERTMFEQDAWAEVERMWGESGRNVVADPATLDQLEDLAGIFRSAYLQMSLTKDSLRVWGRALAPEYGR